MSDKNEKVALAIGRWMPLHNGHAQFLTELAATCDKLIIGIGSSNIKGTKKNCIHADLRRRMLEKVLINDTTREKITFIDIDDGTDEFWFDLVNKIIEEYKVTEFYTGNKEDILSKIESGEYSIKLPIDRIINPEEMTNVKYHATQIRDAIAKGDQSWKEMVPQVLHHMIEEEASLFIKEAYKTEKEVL